MANWRGNRGRRREEKKEENRRGGKVDEGEEIKKILKKGREQGRREETK